MDNPPAETGRPAERPGARGRRLVLPVLAVALVGLLWAGGRGYLRGPAPQGQAPPVSGSPFLNTRPGVRYVGDERCAECHLKEALSYREHPMGRSVGPATQGLPAQGKAPPRFTAGGLEYAVERGRRVVHREVCRGPDGRAAAEQGEEVAWAVGSGRQGQTFLLDRGGFLFESPVSWYARRNAWDLSPGYQEDNHHFNRPVLEVCLYCHTNGAPAVPGAVNHYGRVRLEPVGCERCHGPGELHVEARLGGEAPAGADYTIVNPRRLDPPLREAVCEQCHLQGEARVERRGRSAYDYRPGLPLDEFVAVFVRPPRAADARKAVSHAEQMVRSRCYTASGGKLSCASCHDPHALPAERDRVSFYRARCLGCHSEHDCKLPPRDRREESPPDSCVDCHMPRADSSNIAHAAITDHRVVRRPGQPDRADPLAAPGGIPLVPFHRALKDAPRDELARDLGLAMVRKLQEPLPAPLARRIASEASARLAPAARSDPEDVAAGEGLGSALQQEGRPREALAVLERVLAKAPRREEALEVAAQAALQLNELGRSERYWRRLVEVNPWRWEGHAFLANVLALRGRWGEAEQACRKALRLNPLVYRPRTILVRCLVRSGQEKKARAELERLKALHPARRDELDSWFQEQLREGE